jgi:hypothetical protein
MIIFLGGKFEVIFLCSIQEKKMFHRTKLIKEFQSRCHILWWNKLIYIYIYHLVNAWPGCQQEFDNSFAKTLVCSLFIKFNHKTMHFLLWTLFFFLMDCYELSTLWYLVIFHKFYHYKQLTMQVEYKMALLDEFIFSS